MIKKYFKNIQYFSSFILIFFIVEHNCFSQNVAINNTGELPAANAILDVKSISKGILIPRVNLTDSSNPIAGFKPVGLLVWNDSTDFDKGKGFYFWTGAKWHPLTMVYKAGVGILIDSATNTISSLGNILNAVNQPGIVPAPTSSKRLATYQTDFNGNPAWKKEDKTTYYIEQF